MTHEFDQKLILLILTGAIILLGTIPSCVCESYETCNRTTECGDISDIEYPLWGEGRPESCGYPGFELTCRDGNTLLLNMSSVLYRILDIDHNNQSLLVSRDDLSSDLCQPSLVNTTLNFTIFDFPSITDYRNITIFYGCHHPDQQQEILPTPPYEFSCRENLNTFYTRDTHEQEPGLPGSRVNNLNILSCDTNIIVPVNEIDALHLENRTTATREILKEAIVRGFLIQWSADNINCSNCVEHGGLCGRDLDSESFACYYESGSWNLGMIIGLSIGSAVIVGVLVWLVFYLRQRRKKSEEISTTISSKPLSSPSAGFNRYAPWYTTSKSDLGQESSYFGVQVFNYSELEEATDNFHPSRILGDGGFGTVYYGMLSDGRIVAVKRLYENNCKRVEQFMNEVQILTRLRHENLVKLYGCTSKLSHELLLVYEYIPNGTVSDHLHGQQPGPGFLSWPVRLNIAIETAEALNYLHKSDIIHRDVKTNNILLDGDFHVRVADFGLSRLFPTDVTHVTTAPQGTPGYVDPEYYQCYQLNEKSDVYSFGVVLVELISSLQAVDTNRHRHDINLANMAVNKIHNRALHELVDSGIGFETDFGVRRMVMAVAELAFRCLLQVGEMRPSMEEVLGVLKGIKDGGLNGEKADVAEILSVGV